MILSFAILAVVIFLLEIGLGIAGYVKHSGLQQLMENQFNTTMKHYNDREDYRDAWTLLQTELDCCGTYGPNDWDGIFSNKTLSPACCKLINLSEAQECTTLHAINQGCLPKLLGILDSKTLVLAGVVLAVAGIQVNIKIYFIFSHFANIDLFCSCSPYYLLAACIVRFAATTITFRLRSEDPIYRF